MHVLIIDDDEGMLDLLEDVITSAFPRLRIGRARNLLDGEALLDGHHPRLIVCDVKFPGERTGIHFMLETHERRPETRFVLVSSYMTPEDIGIVKDRGVSYFSKPFEIEKFIAAVRALLGE